MIVADKLTRYFGRKAVVHDLSLSIPRGGVTAFLGRNGSGKTTTIRMLLGMLEPTRGSSRLLGHDSRNLPPETRARIGYMAEAHPLYGWMRPAQLADFQRRFYPRWNQELFEAIVAHFRIDSKTKAGQLSRGQRAGVSLGLTLAAEPELLILDDPALGLDPVARRLLLETMLFYTRGKGRTILFSSHQLDDVERVADHVAILDHAILRASCPMEVFRGRVREVVLRFDGQAPPTPSVPGLLRTQRFERELRLTVANFNGHAQELAARAGAAAVEENELGFQDQVLAYMGDRGDESFFLNSLRAEA
ncbi:MAG: ABC transporter ATP-binding protein [Planctomycetota bacterium]|nr:ABC transporter ATP-binding protein [Planctomycetota bacterium]